MRDFEKFYEMNLSSFLFKKENKGKTENDYLQWQIDRAEKFILENNDLESKKKKWIKDIQEKFKDANDEEFLKNVTEREIGINERNLNRNIGSFKRSIKFHSKKLKLNRLLEKEDEIDLSNEKDIDKIRFLIELGIIDDLHNKHFQHSVSALSTAISGVTGIKQETLKGYLNAYLKNPESKQNPMNSQKAVQKIISKLNSIGFKK